MTTACKRDKIASGMSKVGFLKEGCQPLWRKHRFSSHKVQKKKKRKGRSPLSAMSASVAREAASVKAPNRDVESY